MGESRSDGDEREQCIGAMLVEFDVEAVSELETVDMDIAIGDGHCGHARVGGADCEG